jgi:hypothetical protein
MHVEPDLSGPPDAAFISAVAAAAASPPLTHAPLRPSISRLQRRPAFLAFLLLGGAAFVTFAAIAPFDVPHGGRHSVARIHHEMFSAAGAIAAALLAAGGLVLLSMAVRPRRVSDPVVATAWVLAAAGGGLIVLAPMSLPHPFPHSTTILSASALIAGAILLAVGVVVAAHRRRVS